MPIQDAVSPVQKVSITELAKEFVDQFGVLSWGQPEAEEANKINVTLQIKNPLQQNLPVKERIRLTCASGAVMNKRPGYYGTVLSGAGSDDMIVETDETTGRFDLEATYAEAGTITVAGGATQGSGLVACRSTVDLTFA